MLNEGAWDPELTDEVFTEHTHAARRDRAHGQLRMTGNAELADEEDVERRIKFLRDLERDRDAAARQPKHDDVVPAGVGG